MSDVPPRTKALRASATPKRTLSAPSPTEKIEPPNRRSQRRVVRLLRGLRGSLRRRVKNLNGSVILAGLCAPIAKRRRKPTGRKACVTADLTLCHTSSAARRALHSCRRRLPRQRSSAPCPLRRPIPPKPIPPPRPAPAAPANLSPIAAAPFWPAPPRPRPRP